MTCHKARFAVYRTYVTLLSLTTLVAASMATASLYAQQSALEKLTPEYLIGSAVSLSNQKYEDIEKAIQRFRNGDSEGALEFLKKAKEKYPKLPPVDVTYAKMHLAIRNANAARAALVLLERAITENPEDPEAYLLLADQAFAGRRIAEAQALFEFVEPLVEKFDKNTKRKKRFEIRVLAGRAAVAESRKLWQQSQQLLLKWIEVDPDSPAAHQRLGASLFQLKKPKEALEEFRKARAINPATPNPFISLGLLFSRNGDNKNAQKSFEKAYAENKEDATVARAYAEWLIQQNELEQAQAIAEAMRKQAPDSITALLLDGIVALMRGQSEKAKQTMAKILSLEPSHFTATDLLALLLIQSEEVADQERALSYAQMNSQRFPDNARANITRAWILYRLGRGTEFQAAIEKVGRRKVAADSAFIIAKIMNGQGKKDAAIKELERLLQQKTTLFVFRREAEELLKQLKSE